MSTTRVLIKTGDKPPEEALEEVKAAKERPIMFDDDSPCFSKEELRIMADKARERKKSEKKPVIALRISPDTLEMARATGKGYTGFLSRLLDLAIHDAKLVAKALE